MTDNKVGYSLKVPESRKTIEEFYRPIFEELVPFNTTAINDYVKQRQAYAIVNGDTSIYREVLKTLKNPLHEMFEVPWDNNEEEMTSLSDRIYPKLQYLYGQMWARPDNIGVLNNSTKSAKLKDQLLQKAFEDSLNEEIELMQRKIQLEQQQGLSPMQAELQMDQNRSTPKPEDIKPSDFKSEIEIFYSKVIEYFKYKHSSSRLRVNAFKSVPIVDRCFVGIVENANGQPVPEVFNTLHSGYHKSHDQEYTHRGDYFWNTEWISVSQAYDELIHKVNEEELDKLASYTGLSNLRPNESWDIKSGKAEAQYNYTSVIEAKYNTDIHDRNIGKHQGNGTSFRYNTERLIPRTRLWFIAYRKLVFLTTVNEVGEYITDLVPDTYEIPKKATAVKYKNKYGFDSKKYEWADEFGEPISAEILWKPRVYECKRYGEDLYIDGRECRYQRDSIDEPFNIPLPVKGKIFNSFNAESKSLVERGASLQLQYHLIKDLQVKEIAKYEGYIKNVDISQIPDYLTKDPVTGEDLGLDKMAVWRYFRRKIGESYSDPTNEALGLPANHQKTVAVRPEVAGAIGEILNMQQLLELIDRELGLVMLVPPQAEGIFKPNSNVGDNQQTITQIQIMQENLFSEFDDLYKELVEEYVIQFTNYYKQYFEENPEKTETFLHYVTPGNTREVLKVKPEYLDTDGLGTYIENGGYGEKYRDLMVNAGLLQAAAQNQGEGLEIISEIVSALVRGGSPAEIHKMIVLATRKQEERQAKIQEANNKALMLQQQMEQQKEDKKHRNNLDVETLKGEYKLENTIIDNQTEQDGDEIPKDLEIQEKLLDIQKKRKELTNNKQN